MGTCAAAEPMWKYQQLRRKLGRTIRKIPAPRRMELPRSQVRGGSPGLLSGRGGIGEGRRTGATGSAGQDCPALFRLELGPNGISDCEAYQKALAEFVAIAKEGSIHILSEDNAEASFDAKLMKWRAWPGRFRLKAWPRNDRAGPQQSGPCQLSGQDESESRRSAGGKRVCRPPARRQSDSSDRRRDSC